MKNTVKTTTAVLAAIMAMSCTAVPAFAESTSEIPSDYTAYTDTDMMDGGSFNDGGWEINGSYIAMSKNPEAKAAFKKATEKLMGVDYQPIAVLGTQVVAGTNYAILVRSTVVYPGAQAEIKVMYIYEDLQGYAEVTGFQTIIGEQLDNGFTANSGKLSLGKNKTVRNAYRKAMKGLTGVSYSPAAYLGSQAAAGTNYMVLCRSQEVYPGAPYEWSLVTVNRDNKGKASLVDIEDLILGDYDDDMMYEDVDGTVIGDFDGTVFENDGVTMDSIASPWTEYATVDKAAKAAGVNFTAPKKIGQYEISDIQSMNGLVEVNYKFGENTICIRKGTGTGDISGDNNTYKNVSEKKINGNTVTIKSNGKGVSLAVWTDGKFSYAINADNAITVSSLEFVISKLG
ncbi:MAG: hypothetical protein IK990_10400 [Ruminiclostridium sp.]|nr:hypothetical protein [Ruminiclostridium sp.]